MANSNAQQNAGNTSLRMFNYNYDENIDEFSVLYSASNTSRVAVKNQLPSHQQRPTSINFSHHATLAKPPSLFVPYSGPSYHNMCEANLFGLFSQPVADIRSGVNIRQNRHASLPNRFLSKAHAVMKDYQTPLSNGWSQPDLPCNALSQGTFLFPPSQHMSTKTSDSSVYTHDDPYTWITQRSMPKPTIKSHTKTGTNPNGAGRPKGKKNNKGTKDASNPHWHAMLDKLRRQGSKARYDHTLDKGTKKDWTTARRAYLREKKTGVKNRSEGEIKPYLAVTQPVPAPTAYKAYPSVLPTACQPELYSRSDAGPEARIRKQKNIGTIHPPSPNYQTPNFRLHCIDGSNELWSSPTNNQSQTEESISSVDTYVHPQQRFGRFNEIFFGDFGSKLQFREQRMG